MTAHSCGGHAEVETEVWDSTITVVLPTYTTNIWSTATCGENTALLTQTNKQTHLFVCFTNVKEASTNKTKCELNA